MLEPQADRRATWPDAIDLIRAEIEQLMALGATEIQLDLPQVGMGLADGGRDTAEAVDAVTTIFAGLVGLQRSIHQCYGDFGARSWARNGALRPLLLKTV
jgi:methionine synthase II (cobalamin-independent)